jgi:hypothetical protein
MAERELQWLGVQRTVTPGENAVPVPGHPVRRVVRLRGVPSAVTWHTGNLTRVSAAALPQQAPVGPGEEEQQWQHP